MYSFRDDYSEGCHPGILEALSTTNMSQQDGYGDDEYSLKAKQLIKKRIGNENADIFFVSGGTQANLSVIASILRPHEAVVAVRSGHIAVHEAGAIESTGHKVCVVDSSDGKIVSHQIKSLLEEHKDVPHMVKPRLVYISNSTEVGTFYTKAELADLYDFCKKNGMYLYLDGARIGMALSAKDNDLQFADLAVLTDVFYIGGTKNGALLGEAIVINNNVLKADFAFHLKQRGALLAKGRVLGIQFYELFKDNLYLELAQWANDMAQKLAKAIKNAGYQFYSQPATNQLFPIFPNELILKLEKEFSFYRWCRVDDKHTVIRLVTSWATREEAVEEFAKSLKG
ncbi:MAG TPA: aminotransferase class I/II-fold pyridoxal phosphate-dependent enzyme [Bacteroidales bacterium]|nr:aminotransferase class I/II-fold pyridoxal phosphate-dependent enzyme [Bacteroidales bacterium]